jgi:hypothetical protein
MDNEDLIKQIDGVHKSNNDALALKQLDRYMDCFSDNLQYKQLNGKIINKKRLIEDTQRYFDRIKNFSSRYERNEFSTEDNKVVERLIQYAQVSIRVFVFFSKKWEVEREGIYEWVKIDNCWKIAKVEILKEIIL